jgi:ribonuclease BN (tRNA processing enzyme)
VGYRIEENGRTLVYLPDHEPSIGVHLVEEPSAWISGHDVAHEADVLFHDAQYRDDEYADHIGWGHSCVEHVMGFAHKAAARSVVLFHHDPYHTDDELDVLLADARRRWAGAHEQVCLAHEGMTITLDGDGVRFSA